MIPRKQITELIPDHLRPPWKGWFQPLTNQPAAEEHTLTRTSQVGFKQPIRTQWIARLDCSITKDLWVMSSNNGCLLQVYQTHKKSRVWLTCRTWRGSSQRPELDQCCPVWWEADQQTESRPRPSEMPQTETLWRSTERERQREVHHGSSLHSSSSSVCFLLCFLWWLLPADLQMWWLVTCRRSTRKGRTPNTADWPHLWCHSTGREFSSGRRSPNHQKPWQTEDEILLNRVSATILNKLFRATLRKTLSNNKTIKETSEDNLIKRSFCNLVMTQRGSSNARFRPLIGWLKDDD